MCILILPLIQCPLLSELISILLNLLTAEAESIVTFNRRRRNQPEREHSMIVILGDNKVRFIRVIASLVSFEIVTQLVHR